MQRQWLELAIQTIMLSLLLIGCVQTTDAPTVVIAPREGPPGTTVQVSADGFDANTDVQIGAGPENAEFGVRRSVQSDAQGRVEAEIIIPETAEPGSAWVVVARAIEPDGERATSGAFEVIARGCIGTKRRFLNETRTTFHADHWAVVAGGMRRRR